MAVPNLQFTSDERVTFDKGNTSYLLDGKLINQTFGGSINLGNDLTHYKNYTVDANITPIVGPNPIIGGSAEIRFIGDGSHTVTFTNFTASASSASFDSTLSAINKTVFYFDGTNYFYSITIL